MITAATTTAALALALAPASNLAPWTATGRLRTGATWAPTLLAAGWVTGARTRAWGAALHPWEAQMASGEDVCAHMTWTEEC